MSSTIVALSTPQGSGAIAVIRLSGKESLTILDTIFYGKIRLSEASGYSIHFGEIRDKELLVDEVLVSVFKNPKSYTGENAAEISCHGSPFIIQRIIQLLIAQGAVLASAGEFTQRAFLNGKLDLSQAEAVADLIASESKAAHQMALTQMRGGVSNKLALLREELINFTALIELELDFGEEDVEFADRKELQDLIYKLKSQLNDLIQSFAYGNAIKNGVPVAIVGKPNAGKSTLLNALLNEERALVSDIPGTTRDTIEEMIQIQGIVFRFIDTAGLRETDDIVENLGIERTKEKITQSQIVIHLYDIKEGEEAQTTLQELIKMDKSIIHLANKIDTISESQRILNGLENEKVKRLSISAKSQMNLEDLKQTLFEIIEKDKPNTDVYISNARHLDALNRALEALLQLENGLTQGMTGDLLSYHLRDALRFIGEITGVIDVDKDILGTIFGKFCIGK
jgi:tRNA modification GTPase